MDIITRKYAVQNGLKYYFTGKSCPKSHVSKRHTSGKYCVQCQRIDSKRRASSEYQKQYRETPGYNEKRKLYYIINKEKINSRLRERYATDEQFRKRKLKHAKEWYQRNLNKVSLAHKKWSTNNLHIKTANNAKRRAIKLKATPNWVDIQILNEIYKNCPEGHHVDHIIPLQGKSVCGLHVPWNLQYLTASENVSKHNKVLIQHTTL